jgi:hypothetical protein
MVWMLKERDWGRDGRNEGFQASGIRTELQWGSFGFNAKEDLEEGLRG